MDPAIAGLLGALIGASAGILGSVANSYFQSKLEKEKAQLAQAGEVSGELRAEIAEASRYMLSLQHSMEWVCWLATYGDPLDDESAYEYHKEAHEAIPRLLGAMAAVSSLDVSFYQKLFPVAEELFGLDSQIGDALVRRRRSPAERADAVKIHFTAAKALYKKLPKELANIQREVIEGGDAR